MTGVMRAGYTVFPISSRNCPAAVAHLLAEMKVSHLFVGNDENMQSLAKSALAMVDVSKLQVFAMPTHAYMFSSSEGDSCEPELPFERPELTSTALIVHSSGSTAFPKPISISHYQMLTIAANPCILPLFPNPPPT